MFDFLKAWRTNMVPLPAASAPRRKRGHVGRIPYLLVLRVLIIVAILVRFFVLPNPRRLGTNGDVGILVALMGVELLLHWKMTWPPERPDSPRAEWWTMVILTFSDVALISRAYYLTDTTTSDFFLFYYLPMLMVTEGLCVTTSLNL